MTASYPLQIKSFTAKTDGVDDVLAAHVNSIQDEVTAIETALRNGPLGIGTGSPAYTLDVQKDDERALNLERITTTTGAAYIRFRNGGGNVYMGLDSSTGGRIIGGLPYGFGIDVESSRDFAIATNNIERLRITSGGDIYSAKGTWVPTWTGLTVTGAPTYAGRYTKFGKLVFFSIKITTNGGTTASTATVTNTNSLPFAAATDAIAVVVDTAMQHLGQAFVTGTVLYTPTWTANAANVTIQGWYEV